MSSDIREKPRTPSPRKAFHLINTLSSPQKPTFGEPVYRQHSTQTLGDELLLDFDRPQNETPPVAFKEEGQYDVNMVRERSPHKYLSPQKPEGLKERKPLANISAKMQSPSSKAVSSERYAEQDEIKKPATTQPEFGKASPLRNPLRRPEASIFIPKPKPKKLSPQGNPLYSTQSAQAQGGDKSVPVSQRPFYLPGQQRPPAPSYNSALEAANAFSSQTNGQNGFDADFFEIAVPKNAPLPAIQPKPRPMFSSLGPKTTFEPFQASQQPRPNQVIDLTSSPLPSSNPAGVKNLRGGEDDDDAFDPDAYLVAQPSKFGEPDLDMYTDPSQADKNIKNLLEGAFDDDEDKSRTRLRRRAKRALKEGNEKEAKGLAGRLAALSVKNDSTSEQAGAEGEIGEETEEEEEDDGTVEGLSVKLLPHQVEGVAWMIDKEIGRPTRRAGTTLIPHGGILADDMGLGKTIQSMTLILTNPRPAPDAKPEFKGQKLPGKEVGKGTLVVAPLALIKQWEDEIKTKVAKTHALRVLVHHGPSRTKSAAELKKYDVVITTYQTLTSEHAASSPVANNQTLLEGARIGCMGVSWYRVILDEAHSIKNRSAKAHQAACALQSHYRWCLTGTPMQNNLDELQALMKFLRTKPYDDLPRWKQDITQPMKRGKGGLAMKRLQVFLGVIMKRRTKDILKQEGALTFGGKPSTSADASADNEDAVDGAQQKQSSGGMQIVKREVETVECDFDPEELEFYLRLQSRADKRINEIKQSGKNDYIGALVLLLRLRQACNHSMLIEMAMNKDKDAMTTGVNGGASGSQTPRKGSKVNDAEMDDLAALMGGVSVGSKSCDVCQVQLSKEEAKAGSVRCQECEDDLARMKRSKKVKTKVKKEKPEKKVVRGVRNRRVIDSDDDDEDAEGQGEWIARGPEQRIDLGRAGGSEDENAEGGGESLGSIDSDRSDDDDEDENDSPPRAAGIRRRPVVKTESDDESEAAGASETSDSEEEASILAGLPPMVKKGHNKPSTKIRHVLRILHAEIPKHKTIVFSQFTTMLDLIEPHLRRSGLRWARYDGSMRPDAREESLRQLRTDSKCRILLCSLKCGSLGLNLTAASRVIIVEPFWNPFVEEQAIDRVHRLNQTVDVKVYRLTVRHTVESQILELQERKRDLAEAAIEGSTKAALGKLTMEDLLGLFRHDAELDDQLYRTEDREMWEKFGGDHRLLDGPSAGFDQVGGLMERQGELRRQKGGNGGKVGVRIGKEHDVYGRRW